MIRYFRRITIIKTSKPEIKDINRKIQWFSDSLGLFGKRDKEKSCFRIFIELLKNKNGLTSDEIASKAGLSRGTVIHHINRLMESGFVISKKNKYLLRVHNLEELVKELKEDLNETFKEINEVARDIDKEI